MYPFAPLFLLSFSSIVQAASTPARHGLSLPLTRHSNLQDTNGVVHVESLRRKVDHAARSVFATRSLLDCSRSLTSSWLPENFEAWMPLHLSPRAREIPSGSVTPLSRSLSPATHTLGPARFKSGPRNSMVGDRSVRLQQHHKSIQYCAVVPDSGSADVVVASIDCTRGCENITNFYNPKLSGGAVDLHRKFKKEYGPGGVDAGATGEVYQDTVVYAGLAVRFSHSRTGESIV